MRILRINFNSNWMTDDETVWEVKPALEIQVTKLYQIHTDKAFKI